MKKFLSVAFALQLSVIWAFAQDASVNVAADARLGWKYNTLSGEPISAASGFKGDWLNLKVSGDITENLSFIYRQRLNRLGEPSSFFNSVDFLFVNWKHNDWTFSAGKQIVLVGGCEYNTAPIDLYICSEYWLNIACYQLGISAGRTLGDKDALTFQICQSPYNGMAKNLYAYNLFWEGKRDLWTTYWSANAIEYNKGKYLGYLTLGNRFNFGELTFDFDFMDRIDASGDSLFDNFSIMTQLGWKPNPQLNLFTKLTYDYNQNPESGECCVLPDTELLQVGFGAEYLPIKGSEALRLFAAGSTTGGRNGNIYGTLADSLTLFELGLKVQCGLFSSSRH